MQAWEPEFDQAYVGTKYVESQACLLYMSITETLGVETGGSQELDSQPA